MFKSFVDALVKTYTFVLPYVEILFILLLCFVLSKYILTFVRKTLIRKAKNKTQISNIKMISRVLSVTFISMVCLVAFFAFVKSFSGWELFAGLVTAALGFALQRPITGVAAWIMMVVKRPFQVGDRIMIGTVKGDVYDITLTHVYIDETGGLADTEQPSGRNIMIPNYKLFENDIINYTLTHDKILEEFDVLITFESNLKKAMQIVQKVIDKHTKVHARQIKQNNRVRLSFRENGANLKALFYAPVTQINQIKTDIMMEIHAHLSKQKDVMLAYPQRRIIPR